MRTALALPALALLGLALPARAQSFTYGPILGRGVTPDKMIVKWGTNGTTDPTSVSFGLKGGTFQTVTGAAARDHEVVLTGLSTDSAYDYYVTSGAAKSSTFSFATCPSPGKPMDVVFYGDSRSDPTEHQKIVNQVLTKVPEMVFESGDVYVTGAYSGYLSEFFPVAKDLVATTSFMAVPGNHDANSNLATNFGLVFPSPRQQPTDPWHAYYEFQCGNAMFIGLDSNSITNSTQDTFLKNQLAAAKSDATIDHVFVWFHHSAYSPGTHGDDATVQQTWVPLFDAAGSKVSAVFSGHDHIYARLTDKKAPVYVVSGGAGATLYSDNNATAATVLKAASTYNFVLLHINGTQVTGTAFDDSGAQIDQFSIGGPPPTADMGGMGGPVDMAGTNPNDDLAGSQSSTDMASSTGGNDDGGTSGGGSTGAGCSVGGGGAPSPVAALALLPLLGLALRRRKRG